MSAWQRFYSPLCVTDNQNVKISSGILHRVVTAGAFGTIDGIGLAIGLLLVLGSHGLLAAACANAASEFAGMGAGQYLSTRGEQGRWLGSLSNGLAAAVGVLAPIFAFVILGPVGAIVVLLVLASVMALLMPSHPWWRSWVECGATILLVVVIAAIVSVL